MADLSKAKPGRRAVPLWRAWHAAVGVSALDCPDIEGESDVARSWPREVRSKFRHELDIIAATDHDPIVRSDAERMARRMVEIENHLDQLERTPRKRGRET